MTPEELRRLDFQVAEKVCGWHLYNYEQDRIADSPEDIKDAANDDGWAWNDAKGFNVFEDNEAWQWKPTTDPACSKALRDKLSEKWDWILGDGKLSNDEPRFGYALYRKNRNGDEEAVFAAESDTEELAVVLCALKSVGEKVEVS